MPLFTIEGIDGCGKSTVVKILSECMKDMNPIITKEPGSVPLGISDIIAGNRLHPITEGFLFGADHAEHLARIIRPALEAGKIVISDRYIDSRFAYQIARLRGHIKDPYQWLRCLHSEWTIFPDRTYLIDVPVDIAMSRIVASRNRRTHFEDIKFLEEVRKNFICMATGDDRFLILDGMKSPSSIVNVIVRDIRKIYNDKK